MYNADSPSYNLNKVIITPVDLMLSLTAPQFRPKKSFLSNFNTIDGPKTARLSKYLSPMNYTKHASLHRESNTRQTQSNIL